MHTISNFARHPSGSSLRTFAAHSEDARIAVPKSELRLGGHRRETLNRCAFRLSCAKWRHGIRRCIRRQDRSAGCDPRGRNGARHPDTALCLSRIGGGHSAALSAGLDHCACRGKLTEKLIRRGAHLIAVTGCADCHGSGLHGRLMRPDTVLPAYAGTFPEVGANHVRWRAGAGHIRYAIRPDATSMWVMPSGNYTYMSEDDRSGHHLSICAFARKPSGAIRPPPQFDVAARLALLRGKLMPAVVAAVEDPSSLDLGPPRYDEAAVISRGSPAENVTERISRDRAPRPILRASHFTAAPLLLQLLWRRGAPERTGGRCPSCIIIARRPGFMPSPTTRSWRSTTISMPARMRLPNSSRAPKRLRRHEESQKLLSETSAMSRSTAYIGRVMHGMAAGRFAFCP